jgi:hypothetical protein
MAGELPKDDVKFEEYELLADGYIDPVTKRRFKRGDTVRIDTDRVESLLELGSIGKKGTVKESEESDKTVAEKNELHQRIHMGLVDPAEKDEESDSDDEAKGSGSVNVKRTPAK